MKRKPEKKTKPASPFFSPTKKGETLQGKFGGFEETQKAVCIIVGNHLVTMSTVLKGFFKSVYKTLRVDKSEIRLEFIGLSKKVYQGGNKARLYRVWLDGKELISQMEGKRVTGKAIDKLFS